MKCQLFCPYLILCPRARERERESGREKKFTASLKPVGGMGVEGRD